jgi:hypothetical protein
MSAAAGIAAPSFTDRIFRVLERVDYRRIETAEDRDAVYRLRYDAYLREGTIQPNFSRRFSDSYDDWSNAWTFGLIIDGTLASSFRMHVSTPEFPDIPAAHVFPEILKPEIEAKNVIVDPTRFVADPAAARLFPELPYLTVRLGYLAAEYFNADRVLATVRSEHQAFYKRVFGHKVICPPRPYPTLTKPISLMSLDYPPARETIVRRHPFFRSTLFERRMLFERADKAAQRSAA